MELPRPIPGLYALRYPLRKPQPVERLSVRAHQAALKLGPSRLATRVAAHSA